MSNLSLNSVATTLQDLKDIVHRNHAQAADASRLVQDMERLVAEMKSKTITENAFSKLVDSSTTIALPNTSIVPAL